MGKQGPEWHVVTSVIITLLGYLNY